MNKCLRIQMHKYHRTLNYRSSQRLLTFVVIESLTSFLLCYTHTSYFFWIIELGLVLRSHCNIYLIAHAYSTQKKRKRRAHVMKRGEREGKTQRGGKKVTHKKFLWLPNTGIRLESMIKIALYLWSTTASHSIILDVLWRNLVVKLVCIGISLGISCRKLTKMTTTTKKGEFGLLIV